MTAERQSDPSIVCSNFSELVDALSQSKCPEVNIEWIFLGQKYIGVNPRIVTKIGHIFVNYVRGPNDIGTAVLGKDSEITEYKIVYKCDE